MIKKKYKYNKKFYINEDKHANRSAQKIIPILKSNITISSVLDVGCGTGSWLSIWLKSGIQNILGVDFMDPSEKLKIPLENFVKCDLAKENIPLDEKFDFVQCLECLEHIPQGIAEKVVNKLCSLGDIVMFSAATPGQGGENHINEQSLEYWRKVFENNGFKPFDPIRISFQKEKSISFWYRYNIILYVNIKGLNRLSDKFLKSRISDERRIPRFESKIQRIRNKVISILPIKIVNFLAKVKTLFSNF